MNSLEIEISGKLDKEITELVRRSGLDEQLGLNQTGLTYTDLFTDKMLIIQLIKVGLPYSFFELIQKYTPFSEAAWAKFLDLSMKSLQRYKQNSRSFRPLQSEKIIELAEVTNVGLDVFGEMEKFKLWLNTPNFALGKLMPIELLNDSYGKEMVIAELTRINYGILV